MNSISNPEADLIQQIYAAAYDPAKWVDVMERLSDAVGGLRGCLTRIDMSDGSGVDAILMRSDPAWVDAYAQHFGAINVFKTSDNPADLRAPVKPVQTDEDCLARDDYAASEYYNDFMRPQDVDRSLFIRLGLSGTVASTINIGRRTGEVFDQADLDFAARMQPHLVRAYEISRQIARPLGVIHTLAEALQHSPHALFLVEADCSLTYANRVAEKLLARDRGLIVIRGRLTPRHSDAARRFEAMIGQASRREGARLGATLSVPREGSRLPLAVRTAPLPLEDGPIFLASAPVLVSVTDLEADVATPTHELKDLFGLTAAEVKLAAAVFEGLSLPEAAEKFGISINTVRFQLARIFDKTGVSRQAELVKLMMRLAS